MSADFGSFKFLTGDVDFCTYGGKWVRHVTNRRYHVIELLNWEDSVGEREASEVGATYNASLREVDLDAIDPKAALQSCGFTLANGNVLDHEGSPVSDNTDLVLVECCHGYGNAAPLWDSNGNNYRRLIREATRESRLLDDAETHADAMSRSVNAIGTSAHNYMIGKLWR